jgi:hypothetical protein
MNAESHSSGLGLKLVGLAVLLICGWLLLKVVIGVVTTIAWFVVIAGAILGVLWALSVLRR